MSILRVILAIFFPPLAVIDQGCGSVLIVLILTLAGCAIWKLAGHRQKLT